MITIGLAVYIFLNAIFYLIIFDVVLSWLYLFGLKYRPKFLSQIIDPIYSLINKIIPTTFGMFRFDAMIAIIIIFVLQGLLLMLIPGLELEIIKLSNGI